MNVRDAGIGGSYYSRSSATRLNPAPANTSSKPAPSASRGTSIGTVLGSATKAPAATGMALSASKGQLGSTPIVIKVAESQARSSSTLILQDTSLATKNKNVLRVDGPHTYNGAELGWHINIDKPASVPKAITGWDHNTSIPKSAEAALQKVGPLTSANNLRTISKGVTGVAVAVDVVRLGAAIHEDGNKVGTQTIRTAGDVAGGWAGGWVGAQAGIELGASAGMLIGGPVGAGVGGVVGGLAGGFGGGIIGSKLGQGMSSAITNATRE